jgi:putative DNA primase/helicase
VTAATIRRPTNEVAFGRWGEILPALGVPSRFLNGKNQPCPVCGGKDRARYTDRFDRGNWICTHCGAGDGFMLLQRLFGWDFAQAAREVDRVIGNLPVEHQRAPTKPKRAASHRAMEDLELASQFLAGPALAYFEGRGLDVGGALLRSSLRYVPELVYHDGTVHPGVVAFFRDRDGRRAQALRLFLAVDGGGKAAVAEPRLWLKGDIPVGGAIRLWSAAKTMGVAEGIETAAAAAELFDMPVWATGGDHLLQKWEPPEIAERIFVFGDNDPGFAGQAAAYGLAKRLASAHAVEVRIPDGVKDWNDELRRQKGEGNA